MKPHPHAASLTRLAFSGYFLVGAAGVVFAPLLPSIIAEFDLSLTAAALLFPALSLGGLVGGLGAGPLVDRFGTKPVVLGSVALSALGMLATAAGATWHLVLAGLATMGLGQRALGTSLNTLVARVNPEQSGKYLNYLHGVYGTGALIAPLVIGAALVVEGTWRWIFAAPALLWLLFLAAAARRAFPAAAPRRGARRLSLRLLAGNPVLATLLLVAFGYNGVSFSLLGWVKTYLDLAGNVQPFLSTGMISIFYAALTLGRFICGTVARRLGYAPTVLMCAAGTAVAYPLVVVSQAPALLATGVFLSGLFLSGLYPTALAIAMSTFNEKAGTVTGLLTTAMTAGSMLPPWWTGAIADAAGFRTAMAVNMVIVFMLVAAALALVRRAPGAGAPASAGQAAR